MNTLKQSGRLAVTCAIIPLLFFSELSLADSDNSHSERIPLPPLLKSKIVEEFYPAPALRKGEQGFVLIEFKIEPSGETTTTGAIGNTGQADLADAALRYVKRSRFSVPPDWDNAGMTKHEFRIVIEFRLDECKNSASVKSSYEKLDSEWTDDWVTITARKVSC